MMKNNKTMILSTIVCLLPMALAAVIYKDLPDQIAVHFNSAGEANNYLPKAVTAFGLPILFAAINIFSQFRRNQDPRGENASITIKKFTSWLIPLLSVCVIPATLFMAMGTMIPFVIIGQAFAGVIIVFLGNYLPKCKQNYTIGIKLPWTLHDEINWNKTHRFTGFVWVIGGVIILLNAFIANNLFVMIGILILLAALPFIYSFCYYRNHLLNK